MKKPFLLLFALIVSALAHAQDINFSRGPEYIDDKGTNIIKLLGDDGSGYLALRKGKEDYYIEKHTYDLVKISTNKIQSTISRVKEYSLVSALLIKGQVCLFMSKTDKETGDDILHVVMINEEGEEIQSPFVVDIIKGINKKRNGIFMVYTSVDSSKILIVKDEMIDNNPERQHASLTVLNSDLSVLFKKDVGKKYEDRFYECISFVLENNGNVHMVVRDYIPLEERDEYKYKYAIFSYSYKGNVFKKNVIHIDGHYISEIEIKTDNNGTLLGCGFYTSDKKDFSMKGVFFFKTDSQDTVFKITNQEFTKEFLSNFLSEKKIEKGKELLYYHLRSMHVRSDGGVVFVAEYKAHYTKTTTQTSQSGNYTSVRVHHTWEYNDLIVVNINSEGVVENTSMVPKRQEHKYTIGYSDADPMAYEKDVISPYTDCLGIATVYYQDKLYILYNDMLSNMEVQSPYTKMKKMTNVEYAYTVVAIVDKEGKVSRSALFPARGKGEKSTVQIQYRVNTSPNTMILFCEFANKYKLIKLQF